MPVERPHAEALGDHDYLIRVGNGEDTAEIRMHASSAALRRLALANPDERRIVEETAAYLIQRQRADDLPADLDLDDVAAAYDDYVDNMHTQLAPDP